MGAVCVQSFWRLVRSCHSNIMTSLCNPGYFHVTVIGLLTKTPRHSGSSSNGVTTHVAFGSGGFSLACENLGRMFEHFPPAPFFFFFFFLFVFFTCAFLLLLLLFFFFPLKWRIARAHYFHSLCQDQSTVTQRAETTVAKCSLTSCVQARFRIGSHTMPGQRHSQPTPTSLGEGRMSV